MNLSATLDSEDPIELPAGMLLHANVAARLRTMILTGQLQPGDRLNERVLCSSLRVSRTPLREAFRVLAAQRLVQLHPNRGASVVELSERDIRNLFEVMTGLEGLCGSLAAQRVTDQQLDEIRALHFEMLAAHARRDLPSYYELNQKIHHAISLAADNPALFETYEAINIRIQHLRFQSNFNRIKWDAAVVEHGKMIDALSARDGALLQQLLESHLINKRDTVLAAMSEHKLND